MVDAFAKSRFFGWQGENSAYESCQRHIVQELDWIGEESANVALAKVSRLW